MHFTVFLETFQQMPPSDLLQLQVAAPRAYGHLVPLLHHILEAGVEHVLLLQVQDAERLAHLLARLNKDVRPALEDVVRGDGAVVGALVHRVFDLLVPAAAAFYTLGQYTLLEYCFLTFPKKSLKQTAHA